MTVAELIEELRKMPQYQEVNMLPGNNGDYLPVHQVRSDNSYGNVCALVYVRD